MESKQDAGRIVGLFTHPVKSYKKSQRQDVKAFAMIPHDSVNMVKGGIEGDSYLGRKCEITAIGVETIAMYSKIIGHTILPGQMRSNIETSGIDLAQLFRDNDQQPFLTNLGDKGVVQVYGLRTPCWKMNDLFPGIDLEKLMWGNKIMVDDHEVQNACEDLDQGVKMRVVEPDRLSKGGIVKKKDS